MDAEQTKALLKAAVSRRTQLDLPTWLGQEGLEREAFNEWFIGMGRDARARMGADGPPLEFVLALMSAGFTMGWEAKRIAGKDEERPLEELVDGLFSPRASFCSAHQEPVTDCRLCFPSVAISRAALGELLVQIFQRGKREGARRPDTELTQLERAFAASGLTEQQLVDLINGEAAG